MRRFHKEINEHNAPGYHRIKRYSDPFGKLAIEVGFSLNLDYLSFVDQIGYGNFFGGSLILFPLYGQDGSMIAQTDFIKSIGFMDYVVIGYPGTTEGFYCLKNDENDMSVYWIDIVRLFSSKLQRG